jgi:hypothetical protein
MTQPRQSTPGRTSNPRARVVDEGPGDVSLTIVASFQLEADCISGVKSAAPTMIQPAY